MKHYLFELLFWLSGTFLIFSDLNELQINWWLNPILTPKQKG